VEEIIEGSKAQVSSLEGLDGCEGRINLGIWQRDVVGGCEAEEEAGRE